MALSEPTTALTDYLITACCIAYGFLLLQGADLRAALIWPTGMFLLGAAALTGGTFHGFRHAIPDTGLTALWNVTLVLIGSAAGFMLAGALAGTIGPGKNWFLAGIGITAVGGAVLALKVSFHPHFNHNDLFHCLTLVALYFLYRGAALMQFSKPLS